MDDLVQWLREQLDEDDRIARAAAPGPWKQDPDRVDFLMSSEQGYVVDCSGGRAARENADHVARHDPARVLREIDAKRQLVNAHARPHECVALTGRGDRSVVDGQPWELWEPKHTDDHGPCTTLRLLALPYADRPGYREEWRP